MAAYYKAPIVYVDGDKVPAVTETETFIKSRKDAFTRAIIYTGISANAKANVESLYKMAPAVQDGFAVSGRRST